MTKLAVLMDPIESIDLSHDSTIAILLAAQKRGWSIHYFQAPDLYVDRGNLLVNARQLTLSKGAAQYQLSAAKTYPLSDFTIVLMRKDPPFNMEYIYLTYLLEQAEREAVLVVNKPQSLRDANEKLFTLWFSEYCVDTLVSADREILKKFWHEQGEIILKPLDGMGGRSIFYADKNEPNINVILETLTQFGHVHIMAQKYIPEIRTEGDKRILLINGEPISHSLVRIPAVDDVRGNMAAGASVKAMPLTAHEQQLCAKIGPTLREKGLIFVGLDVIGGYITEINVTSPTGIKELNRLANLDIATELMNYLQEKLNEK